MRPLVISGRTAVQTLQHEIQRSEESGYDHRLHGVLLVAHGVTCPEVAALLGDAPRSVEYWVHRFQEKGLAGLREGEHAGRPRRLDEKQMEAINRALRGRPSDVGMRVNLWDGKTLSAWIGNEYGIQLGVRQCQLCSGAWTFVCASHARFWPRATRSGKSGIKKLPKMDERRDRGPLGAR
jgi:transposase